VPDTKKGQSRMGDTERKSLSDDQISTLHRRPGPSGSAPGTDVDSDAHVATDHDTAAPQATDHDTVSDHDTSAS